MLEKKSIIAMLSLIGLTVGTAQAAKSVFIISKHTIPSRAQVYSIDDDEIICRA